MDECQTTLFEVTQACCPDTKVQISKAIDSVSSDINTLLCYSDSNKCHQKRTLFFKKKVVLLNCTDIDDNSCRRIALKNKNIWKLPKPDLEILKLSLQYYFMRFLLVLFSCYIILMT